MSDLTIFTSPHVENGTHVWMKGRDVVGITTAGQRKFFGWFGLAFDAPPGADGVILSKFDYEAARALIAQQAKP